MALRYSWQPQAKNIPSQPGVYRFLDKRGRVIYVGKAKSVRNRLQNYFGVPTGLHERTRRMVETANSVDWTLVPTERQALQLEYLWIKEFQPEFNVRFRDDKAYPYLVLTVGEDVPRVFLARKKGIAGAKYFGPFPNAGALRETLSTILRAFPVRSCSQGVYRKASREGRACLLGDIGKCSAPCIGRVDQPEHKALAVSLSAFMSGNDRSVLEDLSSEMNSAAASLDYERAAKFRDRIEAIRTILTKNTMILDEKVNADVFGVASDGGVAAAHVFRIRSGRIRGAKGFLLDSDARSSELGLVELILRDGFDEQPPAPLVLVPSLPDDVPWWESELAKIRIEAGETGTVELRTARRGALADVSKSVALNARHTLDANLLSRLSDPSSRAASLTELGKALGLETVPIRLECFDVSHLGGENPVASMVVFEDGLSRRDHYRKFSLSGVRDDTEAIYQVLSRRLGRLTPSKKDYENAENGFNYPPSLVIVDGGIPQVNAAKRALDDAGFDIPVCGIAKKLEEIWLPQSPYPVILPRSSEALFLVQRVRDEAHRVAISYQKKTRKHALRTELTNIPGVGESVSKAVLREFGSVKQARQASPEQMQKVPGVGPDLANKILVFLNKTGAEPGNIISDEGV